MASSAGLSAEEMFWLVSMTCISRWCTSEKSIASSGCTFSSQVPLTGILFCAFGTATSRCPGLMGA